MDRRHPGDRGGWRAGRVAFFHWRCPPQCSPALEAGSARFAGAHMWVTGLAIAAVLVAWGWIAWQTKRGRLTQSGSINSLRNGGRQPYFWPSQCFGLSLSHSWRAC